MPRKLKQNTKTKVWKSNYKLELQQKSCIEDF